MRLRLVGDMPTCQAAVRYCYLLIEETCQPNKLPYCPEYVEKCEPLSVVRPDGAAECFEADSFGWVELS